jgi:hypothetical protein
MSSNCMRYRQVVPARCRMDGSPRRGGQLRTGVRLPPSGKKHGGRLPESQARTNANPFHMMRSVPPDLDGARTWPFAPIVDTLVPGPAGLRFRGFLSADESRDRVRSPFTSPVCVTLETCVMGHTELSIALCRRPRRFGRKKMHADTGLWSSTG